MSNPSEKKEDTAAGFEIKENFQSFN